MPYDPERHHRRSVRLRAYDYATAGAYFVTICVQGRECLFGEIVDGEVRANEAGALIGQWWEAIPATYPKTAIDAWVLMPNHLHGVIFLHARPDAPDEDGGPTLGTVVGWFKTMTTNAYIQGVKTLDWSPFPGRLWQRNYHEHIIRNDYDLARVRRYIADNPARWATDEENPAAVS